MAAEIVEADRAALANEIHDSLMPLLFAASAGLGSIESIISEQDIQAIARVRTIAAWIQQSQEISRQILAGVHLPELDGGRWVGPARDTAGQLFGDDAAKCKWTVEPTAQTCDAKVANVCYRVVIEAIRNAMRHAAADVIAVSGSSIDGIVTVSIADDGRGFDTQAVPPNHFGIRSMKGRAELLGGTVLVDSQVGGPTIVTLTIPAES